MDGCYVPLDDVAWIRSLLGLPLNQRGQVLLDDASTTASLIVSLSHVLDGITMSGSSYAAVSARFWRLITSLTPRADAVTRTTAGVGLDNTKEYHRTHIELELSKNKSVLCRPSPGQSRFRANGSHQKNARELLLFLEIGCACGVTLASKVVLLARNRVILRR